MRLHVTPGTQKNYRTELIDFDIAHISLPYNAILGYPTLSKFMAVMHHTYNIVKLSGCCSTPIPERYSEAMCHGHATQLKVTRVTTTRLKPSAGMLKMDHRQRNSSIMA